MITTDQPNQILYSLIARGNTVLTEFTPTSGNFPTITRVLLSKIDHQNGKMSYVYDSHAFHYIMEDGIIFLCMSDEIVKRRIAFAFLEDIKQRFNIMFEPEEQQQAIAFGLNSQFGHILESKMEYYNSDPNSDSFVKVQQQIENVKGVMVENIEKVLQRGEKIELLVDRTDQLQQNAFVFQKRATQLKNKVWWNKWKSWAILLLVLGLFAVFVAALSCGGPTFKDC